MWLIHIFFVLCFEAPNDNALRVNRRVRQLWGFPSDVTREILGTRRSRESDVIVFNGPTNADEVKPTNLDSVKPSNLEGARPSNLNSARPTSAAVSKPVVVPTDGIVHFPKEQHEPHDKDYEEIDLSGSFTLKPTTDAPTMPPFAPLPNHVQVTFANCGSLTKDGVYVATSSNSGVYTFPNGTQVAYSKCEVLQTLNSPG